MAAYEADYTRACLRRIPEDIWRAFVSGNWAAEGREAPLGFVCDCQFMGMVNREQENRKIVMECSLPETPGEQDLNFRGWACELMWSAAETVRDVRCAAWHTALCKNYELAASDPSVRLLPNLPSHFRTGEEELKSVSRRDWQNWGVLIRGRECHGQGDILQGRSALRRS